MGEIVRYETADGGSMELTPRKVVELLVAPKDRAAMNDRNVAMVMATCAALRLNPLAGDCHIGVFKGKPTIMPSIDYYQRVAAAQETFDGMDSGVLYSAEDGLHRRSGCVVPPGCELVGGWATAYDRSRSHPVDVEVALSEYDQGNTMWESKPATMIRKVAKAQALRELYPGCFKNTYVSEELPDEGGPQAVECVVEPMPDVPDFGGAPEGEPVPDEAYEDVAPYFVGDGTENDDNKED